MTDLITENARLRAALEQIANLVHEGGLLGMSESDVLNAVRRKTIPYWPALATPAPDAVQEAARVLLDDEGRALPRLVEIAEAQWDAGSSMFRCIGAALRAIAGGQP